MTPRTPPGSSQKSGDSAPIQEVHARPDVVRPSTGGLSLQEIFDAHARYLWRALLGLGVPERDVDDACQEVFLVVHRRLAEINQSTIRSWLYGVCLRVASGHRRKLKNRREVDADHLPELTARETPFERVAAVHLQSELLSVLDELDEHRRAAFVLYEIEELTLKEVAAALECPLQTAYSWLGVARNHVRRSFERRGDS